MLDYLYLTCLTFVRLQKYYVEFQIIFRILYTHKNTNSFLAYLFVIQKQKYLFLYKISSKCNHLDKFQGYLTRKRYAAIRDMRIINSGGK